MSGVYGSFIENFTELYETVSIWTEEDKSDIRTLRGILMPNKGSGIKRRKYTSGNTSLDLNDDDEFYVSTAYRDKVHVGDYLQTVISNVLYRLTKEVSYHMAAGFLVFKVERVTGATPDKDVPLDVKEPYFA